MPTTWLSPECDVGKHDACNNDAWDFEKDEITTYDCECHL